MSRDIDAADSMSELGSPKADRDLAENFGMTTRQVREFDPQTLDVTRACKFLGLPLKRFDTLAAQPEARRLWVESVARQQKDLIETFPQASKELKEMLEAIRKFALRKCLNPDGPARVSADGPASTASDRPGSQPLLLIGVGTAVVAVLGAVIYLASGPGKPPPTVPPQAAGSPGNVAPLQAPVNGAAPNTPIDPATPAGKPQAGRVVYSPTFANLKPFVHRWKPKTPYLTLRDSMPKGLWAGCYDPKSGGEFRIELIDGKPAFGFASRGEPATAQLSIVPEVLTGEVPGDRKYTLEFEYLTRGKPGTFVAWLDPNHMVLANKDLPETNGQWQTATLAATRKKGTSLRVNIDSSKVTSADMLYVRNLSIAEDAP